MSAKPSSLTEAARKKKEMVIWKKHFNKFEADVIAVMRRVGRSPAINTNMLMIVSTPGNRGEYIQLLPNPPSPPHYSGMVQISIPMGDSFIGQRAE